MALQHATVSASTTTRILVKLPNAAGKIRCYISNNDASNDVYVGGSDVAATGARQGFKIGKSSAYSFEADGGDTFYVVASAATPTVSVIWFGN